MTPFNIQFLKYLFIAILLLANIIASKIVIIAGFIVPAAIILYPFTFLITYVIAEIEGRDEAKKLVITGFLISLIMVIVLYIGRILPPAPFWKHQDAYMMILGSAPRIVMASMTAYMVSQYHDVWAFHWLKKKTAGKHLWLRNNISTAVSQLIDSVLFITIAFGGVYPAATVLMMIGGQYAVKLIIAVLDTPFCYMLVSLYGNNRKQVQEI